MFNSLQRVAPPPNSDIARDLKGHNKTAFTLAEVLITLGIIGVVAALTIPSVIHNYKKKLIETRLQSTVSIISQAIKSLEADNEGDIHFVSYRAIGNNTINTQREFVKDHLMKYIPSAKLCTANNTRECLNNYIAVDNTTTPAFNHTNKIVLPSGTGFWINYPNYAMLTGGNPGAVFDVNIDLNINKKQMKYGVDYFKLVLLRYPTGSSTITAVHTAGHNWSGFNPYLPACNIKFRDADKNPLDSVKVCENPKADNYYGYPQTHCAALIQCNNWVIPNNYPIKF